MFGRRGGIRTRDPLHPMQVRYQAALHADARIIAALGEGSVEQTTYFEQFLPEQLQFVRIIT